MTPEQRQQAITELLENGGAATYQELAARLGVSGMTIRRDVDKLATRGTVIKTLCGVQLATAPADFYESQLTSRLSVHTREKRAISRLALEQIESGQTVFLDGSTTCIELARCIARHLRQVTVVTNSVLICRELGAGNDNTIIALGGQYDPPTFCCVGTTAEDHAGEFFADKAFFSAKGFVPADGTYESSLELLRIKRIIASQSAQVVLLVDHSKFGRRALCKVLDVAQINTLITDSGANQEHVALLEEDDYQVHIAAVESTMLAATADTTTITQERNTQ
jgi:DeoR/GlpR family transcriptional regulator of sugar metabolism